MRLSGEAEAELVKLLLDDIEIRVSDDRQLAERYAEAKSILVEHGMALLVIAGLLFGDGRISGDMIRGEFKQRQSCAENSRYIGARKSSNRIK